MSEVDTDLSAADVKEETQSRCFRGTKDCATDAHARSGNIKPTVEMIVDHLIYQYVFG